MLYMLRTLLSSYLAASVFFGMVAGMDMKKNSRQGKPNFMDAVQNFGGHQGLDANFTTIAIHRRSKVQHQTIYYEKRTDLFASIASFWQKYPTKYLR